MATKKYLENIRKILEEWEQVHQLKIFNPIPTLEQLSEIIEFETRNGITMNFTSCDRNRKFLTYQGRYLRHILDILLQKENFMKELMNEYLCDLNLPSDSDHQVNIAACRLLLVVLPAFEQSVIFEMNILKLIHRLFSWAKDSVKMLENYATSLLALLMKNKKLMTIFRAQNYEMIPLILKRFFEYNEKCTRSSENPDLQFSGGDIPEIFNPNVEENLQDYGFHCQQISALCYLATMGRYEEFSLLFSEQNALAVLLKYIDIKKKENDQLTLEALKYLASLLSLKIFENQFHILEGLEILLDASKESCFIENNNLEYCDDAMEGICLMPRNIIKKLMARALSILTRRKMKNERTKAIKFLRYSFSFRIMVEEFDAQNGLYYLITTMKSEWSRISCGWQSNIIEHMIIALKRYFETHVIRKIDLIYQSNDKFEVDVEENFNNSRKKITFSCNEIQEKIEILQKLLSTKTMWDKVENFSNHDGIVQIIRMILFIEECPFKDILTLEKKRNILRSCLDVISICSIVPEIKYVLCGRIKIIGVRNLTDALFFAANGDFIESIIVQKSALRAVINWITLLDSQINKRLIARLNMKNHETLIKKIWDYGKKSNAILILLDLIMFTEVDCVRALACQALNELAKSERVQQILSKLPMFTENKLQALLENPISQKRYNKHLIFKKYALELMEKVNSHKDIQECTNSEEEEESNVINMTEKIMDHQLSINENSTSVKKNIYSKFRHVKTIERTDERLGAFTFCNYTPCEQYLTIGTEFGYVIMINAYSGNVELVNLSDNYIQYIECNREGNLMLTSSDDMWTNSCLNEQEKWTGPVLWNTEAFFNKKENFNPVQYIDGMFVEFSKDQKKIVGTSEYNAYIYDISTGIMLQDFHSDRWYIYDKNKATFSMDDKLVLNEGILWDVNSGDAIYEFDKLNFFLNGVFHPNGREIISNTEIWDLRTHNLLKTVTGIDKMEVKFSPVNQIIYASKYIFHDDMSRMTSFKILNTWDDENIAIYDVGNNIYSLACNKFDNQIAVVENVGEIDDLQESCIRIYDVKECNDEDSSNLQ